jgi:hypothetical protein
VRKRWSVLASIVLMAACGGSGSPSRPSALPPVTLPDGNYQLAVYSSGFTCIMSTFGNGGVPSSAVRIPVAVALDGDHWRVASRDSAAGSLTMTLARTDAGVNGNAWGTLAQPGVLVTLQHEVNGTANGPSPGVVGSVAGTVNYAGANGTAFCSTNLWSLTQE